LSRHEPPIADLNERSIAFRRGLPMTAPVVPRPPRAANVVVYAVAQGVSSTGSWMQRAGMGWLIWDLTHSAAWIGILALTDLAALVTVGPWSGAVTDRQSAFKLLLVTQVLMALQSVALFALIVSGSRSVAMLLLLALMDSTTQAFNQPVRLTVISLIAPAERLSQAIAANSMAFNVARILGPAAAGAIMLRGAIAPLFAINAVSYLAMIAAVLYLRPWMDRPVAPRGAGLFTEIGEGFTYVRQAPRIALLFALTASFGLLVRPVTELLPALSGGLFHGGPALLSGLMSAQGLGAVLGAAFLLRRRSNRRTLTFAFVGGLAMTATVVLIAQGQGGRTVLLVMALIGSSHVLTNISTQALVQSYSDGRFKGRVMALYGILNRAAPSLGAFLIGMASEKVGLRWLLVGAALVGGAIMVLIWRRVKGVFGQAIAPLTPTAA
jgi:predicted MFS family arabinose efflux permease